MMKSIYIRKQTSTGLYWGPENEPEQESIRERDKFAVYCFRLVGLPCQNAVTTVSCARWRCICVRSSLLDESLMQDSSSFMRLTTTGAV